MAARCRRSFGRAGSAASSSTPRRARPTAVGCWSGGLLRKRVIPCLDVRGGRLVKGINFESLRDCGDPVDAATRDAADGADEIVWLNIAAGEESWTALLRAVERAAETVDVPLCVGGGVSGTEHGRELLLAGADNFSDNTAPLDRPAPSAGLAHRFAG